jgi:hypothetical protein
VIYTTDSKVHEYQTRKLEEQDALESLRCVLHQRMM